MRDNQRKLRNFFINPRLQVRYLLYYSLGMFFVVGLIQVFFISFLQATINQRLAELNLKAVDLIELKGAFGYFWILFGFSALAILAISVLSTVVLTHRFLGPLVPINLFISKLISGDFNSRLKLRRRDEFQELAQSLNFLAEKLERDSTKIERG